MTRSQTTNLKVKPLSIAAVMFHKAIKQAGKNMIYLNITLVLIIAYLVTKLSIEYREMGSPSKQKSA